MLLKITPMGAVRLTRNSLWTPKAQAYAAYKEALFWLAKEQNYIPTIPLSLRFYLPMPPSWSQRKRNTMRGQAHQQTPDLDNLIKSLKDALLKRDEHIWQYGLMEKLWADCGAIEILPAGIPIQSTALDESVFAGGRAIPEAQF